VLSNTMLHRVRTSDRVWRHAIRYVWSERAWSEGHAIARRQAWRGKWRATKWFKRKTSVFLLQLSMAQLFRARLGWLRLKNRLAKVGPIW